MFPKFNLVDLKFELEPEQALDKFNFLGSTLRGGFGYMFKRTVCGLKQQKECSSCMLYHTCIYATIFESPVPDNANIMSKYTNCPHPFVFSIDHYNNNESTLIFNTRIIGKIKNYIPYFVYAIRELGKNGLGKNKINYRIKKVYDSNQTLYYENDQWSKPESYQIIDQAYINNKIASSSFGDTLTLKFITPSRVKYNGELQDKVEFHLLIRTLLRRISMLSYFYTDTQLKLDFKNIISQAEKIITYSSDLKWVDKSRYSTRQRHRMKLGGVVGTVTYKGDFSLFLPLILWGEYLHIGKGTSFGLGKYKLMIDKESRNA